MYKARDKPLSEIEFTTYYYKTPRRADIVNDDIMCFDIETSSGFLHKDKFDIEPYTGKPQEYYRECKKFALCYIWQFSINENVFYGRTLEDFADFLHELEFYEPHKKIIYVHNLAFEFAFLINVLKFDYVFARDKRKPIFCTVGSYEFRCSYFLTRMSLDTWAHEKRLAVKKLVGNLVYTTLRTPLTKLTDEELEYCFHDVLVMYYGLSQYKEKYGHVIDIPYTQTGEVRQEVRKRMNVPSELKYRQRCIALIPPTLEEYKRQVGVFAGGYTHASYTYSNRVLHDVDSWDISSSYPTVMALEKFPMTKFEKVTPCEKYFNAEKWAFMITIRVENLKSVRFNTWLSFSKCKEIKGYKLDNGRVISADYCCMSMTNIDYEIFTQCYKYSNLDIVDFRVSKVGYLSDTFVKYVLELYNNKTQYKGLDEFTATYSQSKQYINSMYGMMVTRTLTDDIRFDADSSEWDKEFLNNATYLDKVSHERKKLSKVFSAFQFGAWVTAYARRNLWLGILALDKYVVYCDTDSIKCVPNSSNFFNEYNANIERRSNERADILNVSRETFAPKDKFGIVHRLGIFDYEGTYYDFKTLGAKKYICGGLYNKFTHEEKQPRKELHMTVSGVRKDAVSQLKSIDEFSDGLVFDVEHAKKLLMTYEDDMQPITWNKGAYDEFKSTYKHGIVAQPTTYSMGMTPEYVKLIIENKRGQTEVLKNEAKVL